ncbi:MAG: rod-binding protein [Gammaproteobacteria bacterium]|nr:rod-binding protein [Gammaproteobacteria bacterium]
MSNDVSSYAQQAYYDLPELSALRARASKNTDDGTLKAVAAQFESLFVNMLLKSMRSTSMGDPLLGSSGETMYREMADQQLALSLSKKGGLGLGKMLAEYMRSQTPGSKSTSEGKKNDKDEQIAGLLKMPKTGADAHGSNIKDVKKDQITAPAQTTAPISSDQCHCNCDDSALKKFIDMLNTLKCQ